MLRAGQPIRFLISTRDFSLLQNVQTGSGTHLVLYSMGSGSSFPEYNAAGDVKLTACLLVPSSRIRGGIPSFPIRLHVVYRCKFAFTLPLLLNCSKAIQSPTVVCIFDRVVVSCKQKMDIPVGTSPSNFLWADVRLFLDNSSK
jgi:hypothetical protein